MVIGDESRRTILTASPRDLEALSRRAEQSDRRRHMALPTAATCAPSHPVQVMLNAIRTRSYIRPHRHTTPADHRVRYVVLSGAICLVMFDPDGNVTWANRLAASGEDVPFLADIPGDVFHTVVALTDDAVIYMIKPGPHEADTDKIWPLWAPDETSVDLASAFLDQLLDQVRDTIDHANPLRSTSLIRTISASA